MKLFKLMDGVNFTSNLSLEEIKNIDIKDIAYNFNSCEDGFMFVALIGATVDGHSFVEEAYNRGVRVFLVQKNMENDKNILSLNEDAIKIYVDNTRRALSRISHNFFLHPSKELKIIGVTGTKGKTTITNYISSVLNKAGLNTGVIGTNGVFYNEIAEDTVNTTPESYEIHRILRKMLDSGVQCVTMEVSSGGIMHYRVEDVDFDVAIFSNLSPDHIGPKEHHSFEHYLNCKAKLFKMTKFAIINVDDKHANEIIANCECNIETFSIHGKGDLNAININHSKKIDSLGVTFDYSKDGHITKSCFICSPGIFSVYNALAVISVCKYLGISQENILNALKSVKVKGRVEVLNILPYANIIIDYAHNGISLENILQTLKNYEYNRLICLVGSIGGRTETRRKEVGDVIAKECDLAILTSYNPNFEDPMDIINDISKSFIDSSCHVIKIPDREDAIREAINIAQEGDIIVLAGKGHENYQLIQGKKIPFNESEIAKDAARKVLEKRKQLS
ncbi:UDP-N-acetylmuramoyl-L-alanyl-D-glutamate--2,6-diaminopimelate ligase [Terrisporobacter mayombei]|nr:UDP-N-acetylmuramoyl-L-alanyl-D-glutamate--2,6-diaminopimelate ligase [Terrisporobacter mayombei]